jgi:hypothetical protein
MIRTSRFIFLGNARIDQKTSTDVPLLIDAIYQKICDSKNGLGKGKILKFIHQNVLYQYTMLSEDMLFQEWTGKGEGGEILKFIHQNVCTNILCY